MFERFTCQQCELESGATQEDALLGRVSALTTPQVKVCARGHRIIIATLDGAYALMFERALQWVAFGGYRDAVLDAHSALEMYFAQVPVRARYDREPGASVLAIREELKATIKTSDRCRAAAETVISLLTRASPLRLQESLSAVRNEAIHSGKMPSLEEAKKVCFGVEAIVKAYDEVLDRQPCANHDFFWAAAAHEERGKLGKADCTVFCVRICVLDQSKSSKPSYTAEERLKAYLNSDLELNLLPFGQALEEE
jgi:hypothetical protein